MIAGYQIDLAAEKRASASDELSQIQN